MKKQQEGVRSRLRQSRLLATRKRRIGVGVGLIVVLIILVMGIRNVFTKEENDKPDYTIVTVHHQADFLLPGKVEAVQTQTLTLPTGKLQDLAVKNGDHVTKGQVILTMHNDEAGDKITDLQAEIDKDQRTASAQQQTINRLRQQVQGMTASDDGYNDLQSQITEAQNAYQDAQASVKVAQQRLNNTNDKVNQNLVAPYDGYVMIDDSKQGSPVVTLSSDSLQFTGEVSEYDYSKLHQGTDLRVKALASKHVEKTPVNFLSEVPTKNSGNNTKYELTANLNPNRFMAGQTAQAAVRQDGIQIPPTAVRHGRVYVVDQKGRVHITPVNGKAVNNTYVVMKGLDDGDRIVTNPSAKLRNYEQVVDHD